MFYQLWSILRPPDAPGCSNVNYLIVISQAYIVFHHYFITLDSEILSDSRNRSFQTAFSEIQLSTVERKCLKLEFFISGIQPEPHNGNEELPLVPRLGLCCIDGLFISAGRSNKTYLTGSFSFFYCNVTIAE